MNPLVLYALKVNAALMVFYLLYIALLKKDTFLRLRRWYFIGILFFSLSYPLFTIPALQGKHLFGFFQKRETKTVVEIGAPMVGTIVEDEPTQPSFITWEKALGGISLLVSLLLLVRFSRQLLSILKLKRNSEEKDIFGTPTYYLKEDMPPFSFFNWIFINTDNQSSDEMQQILLHEKTHALQFHSFDIVLNELLCIAFWWNPVVWLIRNEVKINLEYLADNKVLEKGVDTKSYQYLLLRMTNHETAVQIVNNFNVSQLKQRIIMMNKLKSPNIKMARYAWMIPFACMFLVVNSIYAEKKSEVTETPQKKVTQKSTVPPPPSPTITIQKRSKDVKEIKGKDGVFIVVEKQPEFPGGFKALMDYLSNNIVYPKPAQEKGIQGRVIAQFVIEKDGKTSDFNIVSGVDPILDAEAIRVVQAMPNWKPGIHKGQKVRVRYTLPVVFKLQGDEKKNTNVEEVFVVVEKQPEFEGGQKALMKYLSDNIKYPAEAVKNKIQGRVITQFIVEKDGSLSDIQIINGVHPLLDKEAIRVVSTMPNWNPGKQNDKAVRVRYTMPIVFMLKQ